MVLPSGTHDPDIECMDFPALGTYRPVRMPAGSPDRQHGTAFPEVAMADVAERTSTPTMIAAPRRRGLGRTAVRLLTTTDHKLIGHLYLVTSFLFFLIAGVMALLIRAELARPGLQIVDEEVYNQLFTMHGTIMLLLFATPLFVGFTNVIMPLQIGAPDVAFPRLNMFSYWLFLFGGLITLSGFFTPGGAADFGWYAYSPLTSEVRSPGIGADLWIMGLYLAGLGTILSAVNFISTVITMRAPGMTMFRMPIFTWNTLLTSVLVLIAFPILAGALLMLEADRVLGAHVFDAANGGPILWQHLFWFFGHPEVYIIALPFFGIVTEVLPVFSRKPIFGYIGLVAATLAITLLSAAVWAHHMFATGAVNLPFFSFTSFLIAVPTGVKFFNWIGTMWGGSLSFETPMLWAVGVLVTFLFGGLTGVILASPSMDFQLNDTYFVVGHFHYVVFGTVVFAMFAGFYFWWPKMTGRMLNEKLGKLHFWLLFIGFHTTFLVQHWLGVEGMPRRYASYGADDGFTMLNEVSSVGAFLLGVSTLPFLYNVYKSRKSPLVAVDDPWGWGRSLEWATSSPPPRHNFVTLPRIRSESPAFDLHHPDVALAEYPDSGAGGNNLLDAGEDQGRVENLEAQRRGRAGDQGSTPDGGEGGNPTTER
jgi:cytochrome c oxidase subunit 1